MTSKALPLLEKIVRVQNAMKAGQLENYDIAKSPVPADKHAPSSWGPMMRT